MQLNSNQHCRQPHDLSPESKEHSKIMSKLIVFASFGNLEVNCILSKLAEVTWLVNTKGSAN